MSGPAAADAVADAAAGAEAPAEIEALLRWLADGHFTFLGYREYDLADGPDGMTLRAVAGTGLGILRHDRQASTSFAALPPEVRARARDPQRLILTKANSLSTVHRPSYLDYIGVKRLDDAGEVAGEYRFLGLYTHVAYSESITRIPVLRRKLAGVLTPLGLTADSHDGKDLAEFLENLPAGGAVPDPGARAHPDRGWRAAAARPHADPAVPAQGHLRPVHVLPGLPAEGPVHHQGPAARAGDPAQGAERGVGRVQRDGRRGIRGPAAHRGPGRARQHAARGERGRAGEEARRRGPVVGRRPGRGGGQVARPAAGPRAAGHVRRLHPGHLQDRRPGRRCRRRPDQDPRAARVGRQRRVRVLGVGQLHRRRAGPARSGDQRRRGQAAGLAAHDLPDRLADHADRRAAQAAAHGRRRRRRASVRVLPGGTAEPFWIYDFGLRRSGAADAGSGQDRAGQAGPAPGFPRRSTR